MSDWTLGAVKARNMEIVALSGAKLPAQVRVRSRRADRGRRPRLPALLHSADAVPARRHLNPLTIQLSFADPPPDEE